MEEYLKNFFTIQEIVKINEMKKSMKEMAEKDFYFEIPGDNAKLLLKYITQIENALFCEE